LLFSLLSRISPLSFFPKILPPGSLVVINLDPFFIRPLLGSHLDSSSIWVDLPHPSIPSITINFPYIKTKDKALITTVIELIAINNAAIEGVRRIPYLGNKMPAAKGIANKL